MFIYIITLVIYAFVKHYSIVLIQFRYFRSIKKCLLKWYFLLQYTKYEVMINLHFLKKLKWI